MKRRKVFWGMVIVICIGLLAVVAMVYAGEKEDLRQLNLEWRAISAEYNLTLERFQQASPEFKALREFAANLEKKGFAFQKDAKGNLTVVEKPKPVAPESVPEEPPKPKKK